MSNALIIVVSRGIDIDSKTSLLTLAVVIHPTAQKSNGSFAHDQKASTTRNAFKDK